LANPDRTVRIGGVATGNYARAAEMNALLLRHARADCRYASGNGAHRHAFQGLL